VQLGRYVPTLMNPYAVSCLKAKTTVAGDPRNVCFYLRNYIMFVRKTTVSGKLQFGILTGFRFGIGRYKKF
jgi:hypothetical protein